MSLIFTILFVILISYLIYYYYYNKEGFYNYSLNHSGSPFPMSVDNTGLLLENQYPFINRKKITSKNNFMDYWWKFPNTKNSNYQQVTNNFKYQKNPDIANAIPEEFNGLFYHNVKNKSNITCSLQPVPDIPNAVRIGYFNSKTNLLLK